MENSTLNPSVETLVREIEAINHVWKTAGLLFGRDSTLSMSAQELKNCLQARLLRIYAPDHVYLIVDQDEKDEELYGLRLREKVAGRTDAAHLPVRVAKHLFSTEELRKFQQVQDD